MLSFVNQRYKISPTLSFIAYESLFPMKKTSGTVGTRNTSVSSKSASKKKAGKNESKPLPGDPVSDIMPEMGYIGKIERILEEVFIFRRNPVLDRTEYSVKGTADFRPLTDRDINSLFRAINSRGLRCTRDMVKNLLNSDFVQEKDPFKNYFETLPVWTGSTDYIDQLAQTIEIASDDWPEFFKKWIVAAVACAINPDSINHQVLVLVGKQGVGKTRWLNRLLPPSLNGYLYSGPVNPNNKDTMINLSENLLINMDELEYLNKAELGNLKALITQSAIRLRKAYGIYTENFQRRASFMGSVNSAEFLTDSTGNRRYLCFNCISIHNDHQIHMDDVYSQAYALYGKGFKYWFDGKDIDKIEGLNEQFLRVSREEELLLTYFEKPASGEEYDLLTTTDIAVKLKEMGKIDVSDAASIRRLGQALTKHGYERKSAGNTKPYKIKLLTKGKNKKANQDDSSAENSTFPGGMQSIEDLGHISSSKVNFPQTAIKTQTAFGGLIQMPYDIDELMKSLPAEFFTPDENEDALPPGFFVPDND